MSKASWFLYLKQYTTPSSWMSSTTIPLMKQRCYTARSLCIRHSPQKICHLCSPQQRWMHGRMAQSKTHKALELKVLALAHSHQVALNTGTELNHPPTLEQALELKVLILNTGMELNHLIIPLCESPETTLEKYKQWQRCTQT